MYVPAWFLFFFVPGAWAAFETVFPLLIGLSLLGLVSIGIAWIGQEIGHLLTCAAKALPACWLFDGPTQPPVLDTKPPVPPREPAGGWNWRYDDTDYPSGRH